MFKIYKKWINPIHRDHYYRKYIYRVNISSGYYLPMLGWCLKTVAPVLGGWSNNSWSWRTYARQQGVLIVESPKFIIRLK